MKEGNIMKRITSNGLVSKTDKNFKSTSAATSMTFSASKIRGSGCMSVDVSNGRVRLSKALYDALDTFDAVDVRVGDDFMVFRPADPQPYVCAFGKGGVLYYPELAEKVAEMAGINTDEVSGSVSVGTYQLQETDIEGVNEAVVSFK